MMKWKKRKRLCAVLLILNLAFIWGNSLLPAAVSQTLSDNTQTLLLGFEHPELFSMLVRKCAHFLEFTALGLLLSWHLRLNGRQTGHALRWGLLAACIDEGIQFFVPGRAPGLADVAIDFCGAAAGMVLLQMGYGILRRKQPIQHGGK